MTRKTAFVGFSYLTGLFIGSFFALRMSVILGILLMTAGVVVLAVKRPVSGREAFRGAVLAATFAISCAVGILLYSGYDAAVRLPVLEYDGTDYKGWCTVEECRDYSFGSSLIVRLELPDSTRKARAAVLCSGDGGFVRGDRLFIEGVLTSPDSSGFFDEAAYYQPKNVFLTISRPSITEIELGGGIYQKTDDIRRRICALIRRAADGDVGEFVIGMLFGNRVWEISAPTEIAVQRAGLAHVAVVSGMHMAIAAAFAAGLVRLLKGSRLSRLILTAAAVLVFGFAAGFTVSVVRSIVMVMIVCSAQLANRRSDPLTSLAAAIIVLTVGSPFCVRDMSFILTVSGVLGTSVLAPAAIAAVERHVNKRRTEAEPFTAGALLSSVISALCGCAAVFPASMLCFDTVTLMSPVSCILLAPLCSVAAGLAMIGAVFAAMGINIIALPLFALAGIVCRPVLRGVKLLASVPLADIPSAAPINAPLLVIIAAAAVLTLLFIKDGLYRAFVMSAALFICSFCFGIYTLTDESCPTVTILTEGSGCAAVIREGGNCSVIDLAGSSSAAKAAVSYVRSTGAGDISAAAIMSNKSAAQSNAHIYTDYFPDCELICQKDGSGLTYSPKENIIKIGSCTVTPMDCYTVIDIDGARIIVITRKCSAPREHYDLAVYSCRSGVSADADNYIIADSRYKGDIPSDRLLSGETAFELTVSGGNLYRSEGVGWLR